MNQDKQDQFKKEFKAIINHNVLIARNKAELIQLHKWDKNDSHKNAIIRKLNERDKLKSELKIMLKGKTYEEWQQFSTRLNRLKRRLLGSIKQRENSENEIKQLIF